MTASSRKKGPRPLFVLWDSVSPTQDGGEVHIRARRTSAKYLALAEYFLDHPPNKERFRPADIGVAAHSLQTYRRDVENWVAFKMMNAILEDPEFDDGDLHREIIRELHEHPWFSGSGWKGFYYVQPVARRISPVTRHDLWAIRALGKETVPYLRAEEIGYWAEPSFEDAELWRSRIAINHLRRTAEMYAESALTGRSIGQLKPRQLLYMVEAATQSVRKALPAAEDEPESSG